MAEYEYCSDWLDINPPIGDEHHSLDMGKREAKPYSLNGQAEASWGSGYYFNDFTFHFLNAELANINLPAVDWDYWFTQAIANMNPNNPEVDIPTSLAELGDLPQTVRQLGLKKLREYNPGDSYLTWAFGWAPLISDLEKLTRFTELVDKRMARLERMKRSRRIKRHLHNGGEQLIGTNAGTGVLVLQKFYDWVHLDYNADEVWFTSKPTLELPWSSINRSDEVWRALGLYRDRPEILWELIPWSWLSDYFLNVGTFIRAHGNRVPWSYDWIDVMVTRRARRKAVFWRLPTKPTLREGSLTKVHKSRRCRFRPTPMISYDPFLTSGQYKILGALAISRVR
jgi:hypothetical protein